MDKAKKEAAAAGGKAGGASTAATGGGGSGGGVLTEALALAPDDLARYMNANLTIEDFAVLKVLGKGAFGKVMLVQRKDDPQKSLYALKSLRKAELVKRGQIEHTATERHVLAAISCPFLVHLVFAFQTPDKLYMVLDYITGGEIFFWLKQQRRFSESRCKLYTAEIVCAVEAMHTANIIHRDLKPENLL